MSETFRELIACYDEQPLAQPCAVCGRPASQAHATPGATELTSYCRRCAAAADAAAPAHPVRTYEDAVRHVVETCPRAHRILLRRVLIQLLVLKGGPSRLTEPAIEAWFEADRGRTRP